MSIPFLRGHATPPCAPEGTGTCSAPLHVLCVCMCVYVLGGVGLRKRRFCSVLLGSLQRQRTCWLDSAEEMV